MTVRTLSIALLLAPLLPACGGVGAPLDDDQAGLGTDVDEIKAGPAPGTATYYSVTRDVRRCAWPSCGGYWVRQVNQATTTCDDGLEREACYVVDIDVERTLGLSPGEVLLFRTAIRDGRALLRGDIRPVLYGKQLLGFFVPTEGWAAPNALPPSGAFWRVSDQGFVCIASPCFYYLDEALNQTLVVTASDIELGDSGATDEQIGVALSSIRLFGLIVAGVHETYPGGTGIGRRLEGTQYYVRVVHQGQTCLGRVCR